MPKTFSILTACYDNKRFLNQYFHSVLSQQYANLEIIFVDDCSTDGSLELAQSMNDPRLTVLSNNTKRYCSGTYANALSHATGDICGVVDADDVLAIGAVEKIVELYEKNPELLYIYTQHHWCDENLNIQKKGVSGIPKRSFADAARQGQHAFSHWRTFLRRASEMGILFPEGLRYSVDKNLGFILEELGEGGFHPECLYYYRYYKGNMSLTAAKEQRTTTMTMSMAHEQLRRRKKVRNHSVRRI